MNKHLYDLFMRCCNCGCEFSDDNYGGCVYGNRYCKDCYEYEEE